MSTDFLQISFRVIGNRLLSITIIFCLSFHAFSQTVSTTQFEIFDIPLTAQNTHEWWGFPVEATFTHTDTQTQISIKGFWNGGNAWLLRFAPTLEGTWTYRTASADPGLDSVQGTVTAQAPTAQQIAGNSNYRGHLKISSNGRYFEYADGTPFFLLADTNWGINTSRCGLGNNQNGPFYQYLADRKSKKFTAILMSFMHGFGDTEEAAGNRNEGGYPFVNGDTQQLNPSYFNALDKRMYAIWNNGLLAATQVTWFGKLNCFFDLTWAKRVSAYIMSRYAAYNGLFSLSGEYQYALEDCEWEMDSFDEIGNLVQTHNYYHKPVSIHPSGRTDWDDPHGVQSSKTFHSSQWIDHNWLQTGQSIDRMFHISERALENYGLSPVKPVFLSEAYYEMHSDPEHVYHSRLQPWSAFLNGAKGFGYGAQGMWQFFDPYDPKGEIGKQNIQNLLPWWELMGLEGASQMQYVRKLLSEYDWWELIPRREWITVNDKVNPMPTDEDLTPPHCAAIPGELYIVYLPRGNSDKKIAIMHLDEEKYKAKWFNPRSGCEIIIQDAPGNLSEWVIPDRPMPSQEDWVLVLVKA